MAPDITATVLDPCSTGCSCAAGSWSWNGSPRACGRSASPVRGRGGRRAGPAAAPRGADLTWSYRGDRTAAGSATLVSAVRELPLPAEPGIAYVAGEARTCQAVRAHLIRERGWPRRSVIVKPFWAPGRRGMD
jgi:hypothetical protein